MKMCTHSRALFSGRWFRSRWISAPARATSRWTCLRSMGSDRGRSCASATLCPMPSQKCPSSSLQCRTSCKCTGPSSATFSCECMGERAGEELSESIPGSPFAALTSRACSATFRCSTISLRRYQCRHPHASVFVPLWSRSRSPNTISMGHLSDSKCPPSSPLPIFIPQNESCVHSLCTWTHSHSNLKTTMQIIKVWFRWRSWINKRKCP